MFSEVSNALLLYKFIRLIIKGFYEKDMNQIIIMLIFIVFKFPITHFILENDKAKLKTI